MPTSLIERQIGPAWSFETVSGVTPCSGIRPYVGLIVLMPVFADGLRTEFPVSEPTENTARRDAHVAAGPPDEPPPALERVHGLAVCGHVSSDVHGPVWVWPRIGIPAARARAA